MLLRRFEWEMFCYSVDLELGGQESLISVCVDSVGTAEVSYSFSLCFLFRPWGGQSCPDLAQSQGSTNDVSLKVGGNKCRRLGPGALESWAG